jgi:hypothetical protein
MADPGCDFKDSEDAERCGKTPTQVLNMGGTGPDPDMGPGHVMTRRGAHFCEEHLPVMQGQKGQHQG